MAVIVGVARETAAGERRVALTPETCKKLVAAGATVRIQPGILFAPHPAFAVDEQGRHRYHSMKPGEIGARRSPLAGPRPPRLVQPRFPSWCSRRHRADSRRARPMSPCRR